MILWLALKSARIIAAVFINLFVGLSITAALGLMMVGALNMISVAFAVLFVGLGVDFAIQFSVRYRAERHDIGELRPALAQAAAKVGVPLTLAAAAVAAGFMSFMPTDYRGVSELGQIAGVGMLVAYVDQHHAAAGLAGGDESAGRSASGRLSRLGAGRPLPADLSRAGDRRHRRGCPARLAACSISSLSTSTRSTCAAARPSRSPRCSISAAIRASASIRPTWSCRRSMPPMRRLRASPSCRKPLSASTLQNFVPGDQDKKLAAIQALAGSIGPILQRSTTPPPTDAENIAALSGVADQLDRIAGDAKGAGADAAKRLAADARKLAAATPAQRAAAQAAFVVPLKIDVRALRDELQAQIVTIANLPDSLKRQWVAAGGQARVEVAPKGNTNDTAVLRRFARAVLAVYPDAVGGPISILKSGDTVVTAFLEAGAYALISIALILWIVLRRFGDVLLTLAPLLLAGLVTLEISVLIGMPLNFANIIALPLLLGVGVAFKIYYIMAWRAGQTNLLQSSLTRAVIWSALTTATAFGSLWLSQHPGTSSMGKLLALSLVCTLCAAVLFQPALMGKPRGPEQA